MPRQGTASRHSVMSRKSVRELAQERPSVPGEEKDDKVSYHESQNQDFADDEKPRTSFTGGRFASIVDQAREQAQA